MSFWAQLSSNDTLFAEPQQQLSKITELDESQQDSNNIMSQQDSNNIMNQFLNIPMDFSFANQFGDNGANLKHELAYSRSLCEVASSLSNGVVFPNHSDAELSKEKSNFSSIALITPTEMSLPNMPISAASYQKQQERFAAAYNKPATEVKSEPSSLPSINGLGGMRSEKPSSGHSSHLDVEKFVQDMKLSFNDFDHVGGWKQHDQNAAYVQPLNTFAHSVLPSPPEKTPTSPDFVSMKMANNFNFRSPISNPMQKQMNHDAMVSLLFTNPQQQQQQQHNQLRINTFQEQSSMPSRPAGDVSYPPSSFNNNRRYPGSFSGSFQDSNGSLRINTRQTSMGSLPSSGAPSSRSSFPSSHSEVSFFSDRFPFDQQAALTSASAIAAANARKIRRGPSKSSKSPAGPYNMDEIPREQRLKSANDMYTPRWVRYQGAAKEGLCDICKPGKWLQLKNSAFWYVLYSSQHANSCLGTTSNLFMVSAVLPALNLPSQQKQDLYGPLKWWPTDIASTLLLKAIATPAKDGSPLQRTESDTLKPLTLQKKSWLFSKA